MAHFALIFRSTRSLTPDELPLRNAAARAWALALQACGALAHAHPLEETSTVVTAAGNVAHRADVASVLVIEAEHFDAAVALAAGHPGLQFGTEIEVRPVKSVAPAQQQK